MVDETLSLRPARTSSVYDRTKWQAHYEVALPMIAAGLPLVIVQPGVVYGPGDTSALRAVFVDHLRRRLPFVPARTAFCWGHIEDTAHAHIEAMEHGRAGESYIVAGPAHTLREAVRLAAGLSGRPAPLDAAAGAADAARRGCRAADRDGGDAAAVAVVRDAARSLAGATYLGASDKAARELGLRAAAAARKGCVTSSSTRCGCSASRLPVRRDRRPAARSMPCCRMSAMMRVASGVGGPSCRSTPKMRSTEK